MRKEGRGPEKVLIFGATSAIAREVAGIYARSGASLALVARNPDRLREVAASLRQNGAALVVETVMDAGDSVRLAALPAQAEVALGGLDTALVAHGVAHEQVSCEQDIKLLSEVIRTNFESTAALLLALAGHFENRKAGTIAVISSVSGDRGRRRQYAYAASKAAITVFTQGLRQRLHPAGVSVVTIKLGLVDTPMTAHLQNRDPRLLFTNPAAAANSIHRAIQSKANEIYLPWYWGWIMAGIKLIPEAVFKRLSF
jgi:short-subunit dehydrogenase